MALIAKETESAYPQIPEGLHPAYCWGVFDIGEQYNERFQKHRQQVIISWALPYERITVNGNDEPRTISKTYTLSLNERSALRGDLQSWRGKRFTTEELEGFDLTKLLGVPCQLQILHTETDGKSYSNIASIVTYPKALPALAKEIQPLHFDMDAANLDDIEWLPSWVAKRIRESLTYQQKMEGGQYPAEDPFEAPPAANTVKPASTAAGGEASKAASSTLTPEEFDQLVIHIASTGYADVAEKALHEHYGVRDIGEIPTGSVPEAMALIERAAVPF